MDVAVPLSSLSHGAGCGYDFGRIAAANALSDVVDPARAGEVPGPVVGRLVAGDPGAIAVVGG
jgi:hypothetical protein